MRNQLLQIYAVLQSALSNYRVRRLLKMHSTPEVALREAVKTQQYELIRLLAKHISDKHTVTWIVLDVFLSKKASDSCQFDVEAQLLVDRYGLSAGYLEMLIHDAAIGGYTEVLKYLLKHSAILPRPQDTASLVLDSLSYWSDVDKPWAPAEYSYCKACLDNASLIQGLLYPELEARYDLIGRKPTAEMVELYGIRLIGVKPLKDAVFPTSISAFAQLTVSHG